MTSENMHSQEYCVICNSGHRAGTRRKLIVARLYAIIAYRDQED